MKTILCVDDSNTVLLSLDAILTKAGYIADKALSGDEGLSRLMGGYKPDLIITDLNMPGMNGIEFIRYVRQHHALRFVPILFLTTEFQQARRVEARAAGVSEWMVKPVKGEELLDTIKLLMR